MQILPGGFLRAAPHPHPPGSSPQRGGEGLALGEQQSQASPGKQDAAPTSCAPGPPYGQAEPSTVPLPERGLLLHRDPERSSLQRVAERGSEGG